MDQLKRTVAAQVQQQQVQMLMATMGEVCFKRCITSPSETLTAGERSCVSNCTDRYMESNYFVGEAFNRIAQQSQQPT